MAASTAMVWELWRLSRISILATMFGVAVIGAFIIMVVDTEEAEANLVFVGGAIMCMHSRLWANKIDGEYGFPLKLGYARPISIWKLVGIPLAFVALSCGITFFIPFLTLKLIFGLPFPLMSGAVSVGTFSLVFAAVYWWTDNNATRYTGYFGLIILGFLVFKYLSPEEFDLDDFPIDRLANMFEFSSADYGIIALTALAATGLTLYGVNKQRHGDSARIRTDVVRFENQFAPPCPVSSPALAQCWFVLRTVGIPKALFGFAGALAFPILIGASVVTGSQIPAGFAVILPLYPLFAIGVSSGITRKQGYAYMNVFNATRAMGAARLVAIEISVVVSCMLIAWMAIGGSMMATVFMFRSYYESGFMAPEFWESLNDYNNFMEVWSAAWTALAGMPFYRLAAFFTNFAVVIATGIACLAALQVFYVLSPKRVILTGIAIGICLLVFGITVANDSNTLQDKVSIKLAAQWLIIATVFVTTPYVFVKAWQDRILNAQQVSLILLVWACYAAIYWGILGGAELLRADAHWVRLLFSASLIMIPLAATAMTPWAVGLLRHR
jgi:hypothetical protein